MQGNIKTLYQKPKRAELVIKMPSITYENTKMEDQSKSETKNQNEQSQYEELNTIHDTHTYSGVST